MAGARGPLATFGRMGQPIVVTEKPSRANPGIIRFETNRMLTGMGHERYRAGDEVVGHRPPDEIARRLFAQPSVAGVQVNGNMVTVELNRGYDASGLREILEDLYLFYPKAQPQPAGEAPAAEATPATPADESTPAPEPEATADDALADDASQPEATGDAPAEDAPATEDAPEPEASEAPAEEAPADEAPAEDAEAPAEEAPAAEGPAEDAPEAPASGER